MVREDPIVIVAAARTPLGRFQGELAGLRAPVLGAHVIGAALQRASLTPDRIDEVLMGCVLPAGQGQAPARQAARGAGLPDAVGATTVNKVCGSGMKATMLAHDLIAAGSADYVLAGGMESMSNAPYLLAKARSGYRVGHDRVLDHMLLDGLEDAYETGRSMGDFGEATAQAYQFTRAEQDAFAASSQNKAEAAQKAGRFKDEIVPVTVKTRKGEVVVDTDEFPRHGTTVEALAKLRPAFTKEGGSVTAGNASGINDGAAALVLMRADEAKKRGLKPLAKIVSWATTGVDPAIMGIGPVTASQEALKKAGWTVKDLDLVEANEAFAAQAVAVGKQLGLDPDKLNVNGGAIALGHPIGASGARVLTTLLYEMQKRDAKKGLATLCIGGGMGIAMCVQRD